MLCVGLSGFQELLQLLISSNLSGTWSIPSSRLRPNLLKVAKDFHAAACKKPICLHFMRAGGAFPAPPPVPKHPCPSPSALPWALPTLLPTLPDPLSWDSQDLPHPVSCSLAQSVRVGAPHVSIGTHPLCIVWPRL